MQKICILQNSMSHGGTDTFVINLCSGLIRDGYNVTVVLSVDENAPLSRENELVLAGARIVKTCSLKDFRSKVRHLRLLFKELKTGHYDVFQSNIDLFNGVNMLVAWCAGVPIRVCHSHNADQGLELREGRTFAVCAYQAVMRWLCWAFSNRRCGCSELAMDFLFKDRWNSDPHSRVVHNGIELDKYRGSIDVAKKKRDLGLTAVHHIVTVGRISFQKNPQFIVEVFKGVCFLRDDVDLIWVGDGDLRPQIEDQLEKGGVSNRVHLLGSRDDVNEILQCADLFLLPSLFEGLAIVLIEAQAAGLPCLASSVIPPESNCGGCLYIPLEMSASYWAQRISEILDGTGDLEIDQRGLRDYSIANMVQEMEEVFE